MLVSGRYRSRFCIDRLLPSLRLAVVEKYLRNPPQALATRSQPLLKVALQVESTLCHCKNRFVMRDAISSGEESSPIAPDKMSLIPQITYQK